VFLPFYGSRYVPRRLFSVNFGRFRPKLTKNSRLGTYWWELIPHVNNLNKTDTNAFVFIPLCTTANRGTMEGSWNQCTLHMRFMYTHLIQEYKRKMNHARSWQDSQSASLAYRRWTFPRQQNSCDSNWPIPCSIEREAISSSWRLRSVRSIRNCVPCVSTREEISTDSSVLQKELFPSAYERG